MSIESSGYGRQEKKISRESIRNASIAHIHGVINDVILNVLDSNPDLSPYWFYRNVSEAIPFFIPMEAQQTVLRAIGSSDANESEMGKSALLFLNLKTILSATEHFITEEPEEKDDIIHCAISSALSIISSLKPGIEDSAQKIHHAAEKGAASFVAGLHDMPPYWIGSHKNYLELKEVLSEEFADQTLSYADANSLASYLASKTGVAKRQIFDYIATRNKVRYLVNQDEQTADSGIDITMQYDAWQLQQHIKSYLESLTPFQRKILTEHFGLVDGQEHTFREIHDERDVRVSWQRLWEIERKLLLELKHSPLGRELKAYLEDIEKLSIHLTLPHKDW